MNENYYSSWFLSYFESDSMIINNKIRQKHSGPWKSANSMLLINICSLRKESKKNICSLRSIVLEVQMTPRLANQKLDFLYKRAASRLQLFRDHLYSACEWFAVRLFFIFCCTFSLSFGRFPHPPLYFFVFWFSNNTLYFC